MKNKLSVIMTIVLVSIIALSGTIFAHSNAAKEEQEQTPLARLIQMGVIEGDSNDPNAEVTYAEGLAMIVQGLKLGNDHSMDTNMDLAQSMTKQEYAHYLFEALVETGDYAFVELYMMIADEGQIHPAYMNSIQKLLISQIATLDDEAKFYPEEDMTLQQAADMLWKAIEFVNKHQSDSLMAPVENGDFPVFHHKDVSFEVIPVSEKINEVIVSWGEQPHPGYGISIDRITFDQDAATVYYKLHYPDPDRMYPQVIVYPKASTYVASNYKVNIAGIVDKPAENIVEPTPPVERELPKSIGRPKQAASTDRKSVV